MQQNQWLAVPQSPESMASIRRNITHMHYSTYKLTCYVARDGSDIFVWYNPHNGVFHIDYED